MRARVFTALTVMLVGLAIVVPIGRAADIADRPIHVTNLAVNPDNLQAGGNPNVSLFFRFCSAGADIQSVSGTGATGDPYVVTTAQPSGISSTNQLVRIIGQSDPGIVPAPLNGTWQANAVGPLPASAPTATAGASDPNALRDGTYTYKVTFVVNGIESRASASSVPVTIGPNPPSEQGQQVDLTAIPLGPAGTTARRIYRTPANGDDNTQRFVDVIPDNSTTIYTDVKPDSALGDLVPASSRQFQVGNIRFIAPTGTDAVMASLNAHPLAQPGGFFGCEGDERNGRLAKFTLHLPPGFLGNPTATAACPSALWIANSCPDSTILGQSLSETVVESAGPTQTMLNVPSKIFNVQTLGLEPARLGTERFGSEPPGPFPIVISLDSCLGGVQNRSGPGCGNGDYGINSALIDIPKNLGGPRATISQIDTVLCAQVPCKATNQADPHSTVSCTALVGTPNACSGFTGTTRPFFRNPTSCGVKTARLDVQSWFGNFDSKSSKVGETITRGTGEAVDHPISGCEAVPFDAHVGLSTTETTQAGAASGQKVTIDYGGNYADQLPAWQSALKDADVTLPPGMTLNPAGGTGLEACSFDEFGVNPPDPDHPELSFKQVTNDPPRCPAGSQIGDIKVHSPVLTQELGGKAYFGPVTAPGRPTPAQPWKLFLLIEGQGVRVKLVGDVDVSEDGQIHNIFTNQPEVPFDRLDLTLRGGDRAILTNPADCDPHSGNATLTAWADNPAGVRKQTQTDAAHPFDATSTGCTDVPFAPSVDFAGSDPEQAGATTVSKIVMSRTDGQPDIKQIKLSLPVGAVGSLAVVPQCSIGQARSGDCPVDTKVGTVKTTVGTGTSLLTVEGSLYLAEPSVPGDAATLALVVPAKVGPIDLGQVVVLNRIVLRPSDTGIDAITSDVPRILGGVPLHVRKIEITVDRPGFFINPTGCDQRKLTATFTAWNDVQSSSSMMLAAKGCEGLPFAPKLRLIAGGKGATATGKHPPLKAIVTQQGGEANIFSSKVVLPDILRPNVPQFNIPGGLCSDSQFAVRACPAPSKAGNARVITPVLPFILSGPVYVVQETGSILPKLYVELQGRGLDIVLHARNSFQGIRTVNTFDSLPDVPQSYFELNINGGKNGILNNFFNLCSGKKRPFDVQFNGQNGKVFKTRPNLEVRGCKSSASAQSASIASSRVKVSKKGIASIRFRCGLRKTCKGRMRLNGKGKLGSSRYSVRSKKTGTVKVKLSKGSLAKVKSAKRMRAKVTASIRGAKTVKRSVTLVGP